MRIERRFTDPTLPVAEQIEWKTIEAKITDGADGRVIMHLPAVEVPAFWSDTACNILAHKYLRKAGVPSSVFEQLDGNEDLPSWLRPCSPYPDATFGPETSARQVIHRIVGCWTYHGWREGMFRQRDAHGNPLLWEKSDAEEQARVFYDEMFWMMAHQMGAPNSPQFFNTGLHWAYGIEGNAVGQWVCDHFKDDDYVTHQTTNMYERPQPHACFIQSVTDDLVNPGGINDLWTRESRIFKQGSGTGSNFSAIRGRGEALANGGTSAGLMSFLEVGDRNAGTIKSGGTCLAPHQRVYTAAGPIAVKELAKMEGFVVLSWDPLARRFKAKKGRAWLAEEKEVVRVTTDRGHFDLSYDHPVRLNGDVAPICAGDLRPGMSLFACSVGNKAGYLRVNLHNGAKGKEFLHRMVARDVLGWGIDGMTVHHVDENKTNCIPINLELKTDSEHVHEHSAAKVAAGTHLFQTHRFPRHGADNPMHSSRFWQNESKARSLRNKQRDEIVSSGRARNMQRIQVSGTMLHTILRVQNLGGDVSTFDSYIRDRRRLIGKIGNVKKVRNAILSRFGSWDNATQEAFNSNHRVVSVERIGAMPTYDVEVDCPTPDDKSNASGHNFVIWPDIDNPVGRGIVVFNTRKAAKMVVVDADHPEILDFVRWKPREEAKAAAMYVGSLTIKDYADVGDDSKKAVELMGIPQAVIDRLAHGFEPEIFGINWEGEALRTVGGQNSNNAVRVTNEFMRRVANKDTPGHDGSWFLTARTTGKHVKTVCASDLWSEICRAAWASGDPGLQFSTTINEWHTCAADGEIRASNPCAEYLFLDDTGCNLASLNLVRFLRDDGAFDIDGFVHAVRLWTMALEISVFMASFPSRAIAERSYAYRTLGLGYANLGALLMRMAISYDSDPGRALAAAITALMTGVSYQTSAGMADELGPFVRWEANAEGMRRVLWNHRMTLLDPLYQEYKGLTVTPYAVARGVAQMHNDIYVAALTAWDVVIKAKHFRNAQTTNVAPTGTISFFMDCDTTGVEPDFALIKDKKLAGGGNVRSINQSVEPALKALGYDSHDREDILVWLRREGSLDGCGTLKTEHFPIFVCAGELSYGAHVRMVAAVQPFLSGGVSKSINLPNGASIQDVSDAYLLSHQLGLKAVILYRDGSKLNQPLSAAKPTIDESMFKRKTSAEIMEDVRRGLTLPSCPLPAADIISGGGSGVAFPGSIGATALDVDIDMKHGLDIDLNRYGTRTFPLPKSPTSAPGVVPAAREYLPWRRRKGWTQKVQINGQSVYLRVSEYDDGRPGELFLELANEGSTLRAMTNLMAMMISIGLQHRVPVKEYADKLLNTKFEPAGQVVGHDHIKMVSSIADYIGRELGITYLNRPDLGQVAGTIDPPRVVGGIRASTSAPSVPVGDTCPECHNATLRKTGTCVECENCSYNTGCA